jgi:hypothetical protein
MNKYRLRKNVKLLVHDFRIQLLRYVTTEVDVSKLLETITLNSVITYNVQFLKSLLQMA